MLRSPVLVIISVFILGLLTVTCGSSNEEGVASDQERALRKYLLAKDSDSKYEMTMKKVPKDEFQIYYREKLLNVKSVDALETIAQNADTTVILATYTYIVRERTRSLTHVYVLSPINGDWKVDWKGQIYQKFLAARDRLIYAPFDYYAIIDKSDFYTKCFFDSKSSFYSFRDEVGYQEGKGYSSFYFYGLKADNLMTDLRKFLVAGPRVVRIGLISPDAAGCRHYTDSPGMKLFVIANWEPAKYSLNKNK